MVPAPSRRSLAGVWLLALGVAPARASAHAITGSRFDAPIPLPFLLLGAGATVALTAAWLGRTDRVTPPTTDRTLLTVPAAAVGPLRTALSLGFLLCVVAALLLGVVGSQAPAESFAAVFTWAVWFRGLAIVAILVGNPWALLSPWRTVYEGLAWVEGDTVSLLSREPPFGAWPATVGFLCLFGVIENLTNVPLVPRLTSAVLAAYALAMTGGAVLFGPAWLRRADPLGAFYRLFATVAPLRIRCADSGYAIEARFPWTGALSPLNGPALVVLAVAMVYVVSFDGFANTGAFQTVLFRVREATGLGSAALLVVFGVGFAGFLATFWLGCRLCDRLGAVAGDAGEARRAFAPTLLPIAAAYEIAHNYPYVARSFGQSLEIALGPLLPDLGPIRPLGWLPLPAFWGSQVLLVVLGHVVAVVAAHFVAVRRYGTLTDARRAHAPLVVLMVGYTVLSLWIISQPVLA